MPYEEKASKSHKKMERGSYKNKAGITKEASVKHVDLSKTAKSYRSK